MFAKVKSAVIIAIVALPMLANATAIGVPRSVEGGQLNGECSAGVQKCCNQVGTVSELSNVLGPGASAILDRITQKAFPNANIGLKCSPLSVIGLGSASCSQNLKPVCCNSLDLNGLGLGMLIGMIPGLNMVGCLPLGDLAGLGDLDLPLKK